MATTIARARLPLVGLLLTALTATGLVAPGGAEAAAKPRGKASADAPYSGFTTRPTPKASGGHLGARTVGDQVVYRIDPDRKARTKGFVPEATWTDALVGTGKAPASTLATSQAAWIVGKYGAYRDKTQSAAVEIALDQLLVGGPWALKGKKTKARLAQVPRTARSGVRSQVRTMLEGAATYASTYGVTMSTTPSVPRGGTTTSTLRVVASGTGAGVPNLLVTFTYPGAAAVPVRTAADGTASATFAAGVEGAQTTTATVANVPENRLLVLTPTSARSSRVVVADRKTDRVLTGTTAVGYGRPTIGMYSPDRVVGQNTGAIIDVRGSVSTTPRSATATLYGPYVANNGTCQGRVETQGAVTVTGDGVYQLPPAAPATSGFYVWDVTIPGNTANAPARACSGSMRVIANPSLAARPSASAVVKGGSAFGRAYGNQLPPNYTPSSGSPFIAVYGPYQSGEPVTCTDRLFAAVPFPTYVDGAGTLREADTAPIRFNGPTGYYFMVTAFPTDAYGRSNVAVSPCVVTEGGVNVNGIAVIPN